jgi:methylmalonyl-CoA/ethylmalonyl-CoA epimerase
VHQRKGTVMNIDHIAVAVRDIDASLSYYVDQLGFALVQDELLPAAGVRLVYLSGGNTMLQLVQPVAPCPVADFLAQNGEGLHHICLQVDDIPRFLHGLPGQAAVPVVMAGRGRRACFLASPPNGLRIEVTETEPFEQRPAGAPDEPR